MAGGKEEVNLDNCAEEPIHIPGSIQPHGYLVIVGAQSHTIQQVSENLCELTSLDAVNMIGHPLDRVFGQDLAIKIRERFTSQYPEREELLQWNIDASVGDKALLIEVNKEESYFLLDIERDVPMEKELNHFYQGIRGLIEELSQYPQESEELIAEKAVARTRALTGFDRVMFYQFDADYNGQVIAEQKKESLNSLLHQHFPESDIPVQARQLYLQNPIRIITNVHAIPSRLIPHTVTYDLSKSVLRSVSPMHIQYLKNMGVEASMSISIIVKERLWGLIACHHYSPYLLPQRIRQAANFLGQIISHLLNGVYNVRVGMKEGMSRELNGMLTESLVREADVEKALKREVPSLLNLVGADGIAWRLGDSISSYGSTPPVEVIEEVATFLWENAKATLEYHTDKLSSENPVFAAHAETASGILALPLSKFDNFYLIWFRKEVIKTKNWGGKPEKIIEFTDDGSHRLMPRTSFKLWKENVREKSLPWDEIEIAVALRFRNSLMNYVVQKVDHIKQTNKELETRVRARTKELNREIQEKKKTERKLKRTLKEAQQSNQELEQFAYIASHDLQEPLRKIQTFGDRFADINRDKLDEKSQDYLNRMMAAAGRMQLLIQNLLSYSRVNTRVDSFENVHLQKVIEDVLYDLQVLIENKKADVVVSLDLSMNCDPGQIRRLFQNLIQNAIKFFDREGDHPIIDISVAEEDDTHATIRCKDNGIGIEEGYEKKIFELFSRLHGRSSYEGTGLGLAIVKKIVDRHFGQIWVESQLGKGTTFYIKLPKHQ